MKNIKNFQFAFIMLILLINSVNSRAQTAPTLGINNQIAVLAGGTLTDNNLYSVQGYLGTNSLTGTNYNADTTFVSTEETELALTYLGDAIGSINEQTGEERADINHESTITQGVYYFSSDLTIIENSVFTLTGSSEDIIIFNIDGDLTIEAGVVIILDGINPANVYWNVKNNLTVFGTSETYGIFLVSDNALIKAGALGKISILALDDVEINDGKEYYSRNLFDSENNSSPMCPECVGTNLVEHGDFPYATAGTFPGTNNFISTFQFNSLTTTHASNVGGVFTIGQSTLNYNNVGIWNNVSDHTGTTGSKFMMVDGAHQGISSASKTVWKQQYISVTSASMFRFSVAIVSLYQAPTGLEHATKLEFVVNNVVIQSVTLPNNQNWYTYCGYWEKPNSVTSVTLEIRQIQNNPIYIGTDYGIDDISFSAVDIPNSNFGLSADFCNASNNTTRLEASTHGMGDDLNIYTWEVLNGETQSNIGAYMFARQFNGTYTISLTVTNPCGGSSTTTKTLYLPTRSQDYNYNCCLQTMTYDVSSDFDITETTKYWTNPQSINATVSIKQDNTLYITGTTISFGLKGKIIVEQGAKLVITNSTLGGINTSACKGMWEGIEVWGNNAETQTTAYQGKLVITGASQINDAHKAVFVGKRNNCYDIVLTDPESCPINDPEFEFGYGGGIIDIQGATFNRNGIDIQFAPYSPTTFQSTNPMVIKGNNFAGGILKDPSYKYHRPTFDIYQYIWSYPTEHNLYYAPASRDGSGRTPIHIKLYGVRNNLDFQDNIFDNAESGIEAVSSQFNVTKATTGNEFKNMKFGISILNPIASTLYPHTITENKFNKMVNAIRIINGRYELIKKNEFGQSVAPISTQSDNRLGIYLQNTALFNVTDNNFFKLDSGVYVVASGITGGWIDSDPQGNIFDRCHRGVITDGNNENLQIRCGIFDNDGWSGFEYDNKNWDISGTLANQGGTTDYKAPAGNDFYPSGSKHITTSISFTYNRHRWGLLGTGDLSVEPTDAGTSTFTINNTMINKTAYSCSTEEPCDPCDRPINDNTQEKQQLESDYEDMLLVLDDNNTSQLLTEINNFNFNSEQLKDLLIASSPLSDIVVAALLENYNRLTQAHFVAVMEYNLPMSTELWPVMEYIATSFTTTNAAFIADKQFNANSHPTLSSIERDYIQVMNKRQHLIAQAVKLEADTNETKAMTRLLLEENENKQLAIGTYLSKGNTSSASSYMTSVNTNDQADADWVELSTILLTLQQNGKDWFAIDSTQQAAIRRIAQGEGRAASGAKAALHLVFHEEIYIDNQNTTSSLRTPKKNLIKLVAESENTLMLAYPNPSSSIINIPYRMTDKYGSMEIRGILGNLVETKSTDKGYNLITIDASYYANGIYFITLKDASGKAIASQKISIKH